MESIQPGLGTVESLKTPADEDIDILGRVSRDNKDVELEQEKDFGYETIAVVTATCSISSVSHIQQNLSSTSTPIHSSSKESSNKTSREQASREKMEKMLENCRNERIQRNSQRSKPVQTKRKKNFGKTYKGGWRDVRRERTYFNANYNRSIFDDGANNESRCAS